MSPYRNAWFRNMHFIWCVYAHAHHLTDSDSYVMPTYFCRNFVSCNTLCSGVKFSRIPPDPRSGTSVWRSGTQVGRSVTLTLTSCTQCRILQRTTVGNHSIMSVTSMYLKLFHFSKGVRRTVVVFGNRKMYSQTRRSYFYSPTIVICLWNSSFSSFKFRDPVPLSVWVS